MNAPLRLFAKASFKTSTRGLMLCVCASLSLAGCANYNPLATAPIDPTSPVAEDVARLGRVDAPFPTFADIPPKPTDERPVAAWGKEARQLQTAASALERQTAPNTWTLNGTERFQARALAEAGPAESAASSTAATEAFARQLRERATPPPSPR